MQRESDQAAPFNWVSIVNDRADLDLAFNALDGWGHFHTDTIRGRIRSLQLRPADALDHFKKAEARVDDFPRTLRNQLRRFYLKIYAFENALIFESDPDGGDPQATDRAMKELQETDLPESEVASQIRHSCRAMFALHRKNYASAKKIFSRLIDQSRDRMGDEKVDFFLGNAVAMRALNETDTAERNIETASLYIPALDNVFNMGHYACRLSALLKLWDQEDRAQEWDDFIHRLKIPASTAELFCERERRILGRSAALQRVFLF